MTGAWPARLIALALVASSGAADGQALPPLSLRLAERLSAAPLPAPLPAPADAPAGRPPHAHLTVTGSASLWSGDRRLGDAAGVASGLALVKFTEKPLPGVAVVIEGYAGRTWASDDSAADHRLRLREAYVGVRRGAVQLRLGAQIIHWGRADVINPTDNVAARDYTLLVPDDGQQKLGVPTLSAQVALGEGSLQLVWQPVFRASRVPLPASPGLQYRQQRARYSGTAGGLRYDVTQGDVAWSLSWFRGPAKLPNLALSPARVALGVLDLDHPWTSTWGFDVEYAVGAWILRSESAYNDVRGSGGDPLASRESFAHGVFALERRFGARSFFVQAGLRHVFDYRDPSRLPAEFRALATAHALLNDELRRTAFSIGGGFSFVTPDLDWNLSMDIGYHPAFGDIVARPRLRHRWNDTTSLWAGGDLFRGNGRDPYGRLQRNTAVFVGVDVAVGRAW